MVKRKKEETNTKPSQKKTNSKPNIPVEKYSLNELFEQNGIKPLNAVGFLNYYGLTENFRKEFEDKEITIKFSNGEFKDMYERYIGREI